MLSTKVKRIVFHLVCPTTGCAAQTDSPIFFDQQHPCTFLKTHIWKLLRVGNVFHGWFSPTINPVMQMSNEWTFWTNFWHDHVWPHRHQRRLDLDMLCRKSPPYTGLSLGIGLDEQWNQQASGDRKQRACSKACLSLPNPAGKPESWFAENSYHLQELCIHIQVARYGCIEVNCFHAPPTYLITLQYWELFTHVHISSNASWK